MNSQNIIEIRAIRKSYGPVPALERIDLTVKRGEFFSLLGPSGCGKSTLLRMLAGFETPSDGEIYIDGKAMSGVPPHRRPVNMVFQSYAIFPHLDVRRNIGFGLRKSGLSRHEIDARVEEMLETIKLPGYGARLAAQLSGGERQRVALARALVKQPKVLLLDEPLSALDKKLRERMQLELRELQEKVGVTFVFVTHDQEEALTMSDRIAVMSRGAVHQVGTPEEIYERPRTHFIADFIGSMNFFPGVVRESSGGRATVDCGLLGKVAVETGTRTYIAGDQVVLGVRPERLSISDQAPQAGGLAACGRISQVTYTGDRRYLGVTIPGRELPVKLSLGATTRTEHLLESGRQAIWIGCSPGAPLLLDQPRP